MTVSETNDSIRITGVCGSLSADGATRKALAIALKGAAEYNVETAADMVIMYGFVAAVFLVTSAPGRL